MVVFTAVLCEISRIVSQLIAEKKGIVWFLKLSYRYLLIIIVMLMSFIAHLSTAGSNSYEATYRVLIALELVVLLIFYWGVINIAEYIKHIFNLSAHMQQKIITIGLVTLTIGASLLANHNVEKYFVRQGTNEYRYVKDAIEKYGLSELSANSTIYIMPSYDNMRTEGNIHRVYGDFYNRSSVEAMARLALFELGIKPNISFNTIRNVDLGTGKFIYNNDNLYKRLPEGKDILTIDMTKLSVKEIYELVYYE